MTAVEDLAVWYVLQTVDEGLTAGDLARRFECPEAEIGEVLARLQAGAMVKATVTWTALTDPPPPPKAPPTPDPWRSRYSHTEPFI